MTNEENLQNTDVEEVATTDEQSSEETHEEEHEQQTSNEGELAKAKADAAKYKRLFEKSQKKSERSSDSSEEKTTNDVILGYGEKAYINSLGYTDSEDHAYIQEVMEETGKTLDEVLEKGYVKKDLKEAAEDRKTQAATEISSKGRRAQSSSKTEVDYWVKKGELPEDTTLKRKVIHKKAELARAASGKGKFNN